MCYPSVVAMLTLYLLAGPTASGKTEYAVTFARLHHCEILSCDSSSFYRKMDIGTAKPTVEEQQEIQHWGINLVEPDQYFSIKDYVDYARCRVQDILRRGKNVLVVGGSGFYFKSFLAPVVDNIPPSQAVQERIALLEKQKGLPGLVAALCERNSSLPPYFDLKNPRKVRKALERCLTTGLPLKDIFTQFKQQVLPFDFLKKEILYLHRPLEILKMRIRMRTNKMLAGGLIDEVQALQSQQKLLPNTPAALAIGYREVLAFLQRPTSLGQLSEAIIHDTYALVKKQQTWFRHQIHFDRYLYP